MATSSNLLGSTHPELDVRELMNSLQHACDLELLRLRTAIDHLLQNPTRILAVRQRLHLGQEVDFWNLRENRTRHGRITQFKSDQLLILAEDPPSTGGRPMLRFNSIRTAPLYRNHLGQWGAQTLRSATR